MMESVTVKWQSQSQLNIKTKESEIIARCNLPLTTCPYTSYSRPKNISYRCVGIPYSHYQTTPTRKWTNAVGQIANKIVVY